MIQINIQMPQSCFDCPFSDDGRDYPYCWALHQDRGYSFDRSTKRFPNCPLKPVEERKEAPSETDKLKDLCRVLFNRCRAIGSFDGMLCIRCGMKQDCDEMHSI